MKNLQQFFNMQQDKISYQITLSQLENLLAKPVKILPHGFFRG
jgi:hypothetical protein